MNHFLYQAAKNHPSIGYTLSGIMILWFAASTYSELEIDKGKYKAIDFLIKLILCLGIFLLGYTIAVNYHKILMEKIH